MNIQIYSARLSEAIDQDKFLTDWENEPGNDGFGNPRVEFHWRNRRKVTLKTNRWNEDSLKQLFALVIHRSAPQCSVEWF